MKTLLSFLCFIGFSLGLNAQEKYYETGLRMSGLNNIDFMYKVEGYKNITRVRLGVANFSSLNDENSSVFRFNTIVAGGVEKRDELTKNTYFIYGIEPFGGLGIEEKTIKSTQEKISQFSFQGGLGFVLGIHRNLSEYFYVNLEVIPSIRFSYLDQGNTNEPIYRFDAGINTTTAALTIAHRFKIDKKQ